MPTSYNFSDTLVGMFKEAYFDYFNDYDISNDGIITQSTFINHIFVSEIFKGEL